MSMLKLFGFTAEEERALRRKVYKEDIKEPDEDSEELGVEEKVGQLAHARTQVDTIWVVCVTVLEEFLNFLPSLLSLLKQHWGKTSRLPKVVLWVPQGKTPLAFEQWGERFYAQLQEESEEDCTFLRRVSRCARVLEWGERVEDIPAAWFAKSTGSPRVYAVDELPFAEDEKLHLQECTDCREEAYDQLQRRAEMRWEMLCPSVDDLAAWLEAQEADPRLAAHLADCGLCRETVKRQAWLWEGAGLLSAEQVDAKLAAVGLVEPPVVVAWLVTTLAWQQVQTQSAMARAVLLAAALCQRAALRPAWRTMDSRAAETSMSVEDLTERITSGDPVTLSGPEQWLHLQAEDDSVLLRAGTSPANRFAEFRVEFRRGTAVIVSVNSTAGVVRLTAEHFQAAQERHADQVAITV